MMRVGDRFCLAIAFPLLGDYLLLSAVSSYTVTAVVAPGSAAVSREPHWSVTEFSRVFATVLLFVTLAAVIIPGGAFVAYESFESESELPIELR